VETETVLTDAGTPAGDDLSGTVLKGKYLLDSRIGVGGFGAVYEATHQLARATRAVKVIHADRQADPIARRLFLKEAEAVMRIQTPRAVLVHDVDTDDSGRLFIVMELLRGESLHALATRLARQGERLPVAEVIRLAIQVCEALVAAHARGVVHRDLKPANVMLVPGDPGAPDVKVVDFGIARLHSVTDTGNTTTEMLPGVVGTPAYMSPEQCRGLDVDGRADLYSLGVLVYELLAGRPPFRSNTAQGMLVAHVTETPVPLSAARRDAGIPPALDRLVLSLLAKAPADRPRDAALVAKALRAIGSGPAAGRDRSRWLVPAAVAAAALLAIGGLAALLLPGPAEPESGSAASSPASVVPATAPIVPAAVAPPLPAAEPTGPAPGPRSLAAPAVAAPAVAAPAVAAPAPAVAAPAPAVAAPPRPRASGPAPAKAPAAQDTPAPAAAARPPASATPAGKTDEVIATPRVEAAKPKIDRGAHDDEFDELDRETGR